MKNNIFYIYDKKNDIIVNCFVAIDETIAKNQVIDSLKKSNYILKNSKNTNEQATIANYLENAKEYQLFDKKDKKLLDFDKIILELK